MPRHDSRHSLILSCTTFPCCNIAPTALPESTWHQQPPSIGQAQLHPLPAKQLAATPLQSCLLTACNSYLPQTLSFPSWLVAGIHRQSHRSSVFDPLNVTPRTNLVRIPCVLNTTCDTCSPITVSFQPPRDAIAIDPTTNPNVNDSNNSARGVHYCTSCMCQKWLGSAGSCQLSCSGAPLPPP
jgi:hypothetical protein